MVHHDRCPLCDSEEITYHFRCQDHFMTGETFSIYLCNSCSFLFTQDSPDINEIVKYYESDDYISHSDTSEGFINKIYRLVRQVMLLRKRATIKKLTGLKNGTILDIGCGTGHFAFSMKKAGWLVKGIEINKKARSFAESVFGLDVISPEEVSGLVANSYDCITLWHVLEHFHDPHKYMSDIFNLLKPGGYCLVALPNCDSYDAKYYNHYWAAYDVPRHLWHFGPASFSYLSEKSGMQMHGLDVLPFDVFYISALSEKYKGSRLSFIIGVIRALCFSLMAAINKKKSSSVIYLLRKTLDQ